MGVFGCLTTRITPTASTEVFSSNISSNMSSNTSIDQPRRDVESQLSNNKNDEKVNQIWWRLLVDVPIVLFVAVICTLFEFGFIPHHKSGFFCNDPALSYPFTGDTVPTEVLIPATILLPFILVFVTEYILFDSAYTTRTKLQYVTRRTLVLYGNYMYGMFVNLAIVEVMKGLSGNPRPTFFDICEPDTAKTCRGSEYVSTFKCTSNRFSSWFQSDSYHSFPSGHTSLSIQCGFFMVCYLQLRAFSWRRRSVLAVPFLQLLSLSYSAVCSLTRITDHRHHWWDVLVGAVIGFLTVFYTVCILCNNFKKRQLRDSDLGSMNGRVECLGKKKRYFRSMFSTGSI